MSRKFSEEFSKIFEEFFFRTQILPTLRKDLVNQKTYQTYINQGKTLTFGTYKY